MWKDLETVPSWASSGSKGWKKTTALHINTHQFPILKKASSFADVCVCVCVCVCTRARSVVSDSWQLQAPLSMEFSRQEYWSGLPSPAPGDLPNPGIEPMSPVSPVLAGGFFTTEPPGKPLINCVTKCKFFNLLPPVSSSDVQENSTDHI